MAITIFSIIGVVCAFTGLAVFLISAIALLPVGIYNAIRACFMLNETIPLLEKETVPTIFFGTTIAVALVSSGLFFMMTRIGKKDGKTEGRVSFYGSTSNSGQTTNCNSSSNADASILHQHRHRLLSGYTINYILIAIIWAAVGTFLVQKMVTTSEQEDEEKKVAIYILEAMKSQMSILWINLIVLGTSACMMGLSSLFFILGRKNRNEKVSKPHFNLV